MNNIDLLRIFGLWETLDIIEADIISSTSTDTWIRFNRFCVIMYIEDYEETK